VCIMDQWDDSLALYHIFILHGLAELFLYIFITKSYSECTIPYLAEQSSLAQDTSTVLVEGHAINPTVKMTLCFVNIAEELAKKLISEYTCKKFRPNNCPRSRTQTHRGGQSETSSTVD